MKSALWKDTLREIKKSLGRFLSIFAIVAIGVAFFAGVKAAVPDMKYTADQYFDDYHLGDLQLLSTVGFNEDDVLAIKAIDGVEGVMASHSMHALTMVDKQQLAMVIHGLPSNTNNKNVDYLNRANLVSGRMPEKADECLIEQGKMGASMNVKVGDTITLASGTTTDISESLMNKKYKVVGMTLSPYYLSYQKGTTDIGNGTIHNFMMIPDENFKSEYYTDMSVTIKNARSINSYNDEYFRFIKPVKKQVKEIANKRIEIRKDDIQTMIQSKLDKQTALYQEKVNEFETQINNGEAQLASTKAELTSNEQALLQQRADFEAKYQQSLQSIQAGQAQLKEAYQQQAQAKEALSLKFDNEINPKLMELQRRVGENQTAYNKLYDAIENIKVDIKNLESDPVGNADKIKEKQAELAIYQENIKSLKSEIVTLQNQITTIGRDYEAAKLALEEATNALDQKDSELKNSLNQLNQGKSTAMKQLDDASITIQSGWKQYQTALTQLTSKKSYGKQELKIAEEKLQNAKNNAFKMKNPKWYVLDRHSQYSYMDYGAAADRMDAIAKVFPIFFFVVAALVCLTTMTRMVDEQREATGILKALGYSKMAIASKYVVYAATASILGSIVGCFIGMSVFPTVIFNAWALMYALPPISFTPQIPLALLTTLIAVCVTTTAAFSAVYKELIETPALLMRPKAPKNGKKILLERITVLWKHFSFTEKVTARNIFRYKKRFFMTVIGISGCTALLLAGFGIRDSISQVVSKQYGEIFLYDASIGLEDNLSLYQKQTALEKLENDKRVKSVMEIAQYNVTIQDGDETVGISLVIPSDTKKFKEFASLHERIGKEKLPLSDKGAIISEKVAHTLGVQKGDTIYVNNGSHRKIGVKVDGIAENYINHYVYMSPDYYHQLFKERADNNQMIADLNKTDKQSENEFGQVILKMSETDSVVFFSGIAESFSDTISSLSFVTVVLVISAGLLAFVVLYNLTNVNVSERLREIATIKVLGFYDKEVSAYVYRENILLSIIGSITGLLLGILLHSIIMNTAEMDTVMFGRNIEAISFVYSVIITIGFACIVNLAMYPKLKKIPMVESLKSVE